MTTLIPKYSQGNTGAVNRPFNQKLQEFISVLDFGADSTGVADSSTAISQAIATSKAVYFPKGTYLCNISINNKTILFGDGSTASIIKPYVNTSPAMIYTFSAMTQPQYSYWNYHSIVKDLGFNGTSATSGGSIGFSFGTGSPLTYTTNAEYANNVQFYNCFFYQNYIGVQFPHGNIGCSFYSCGFQYNYYGVYMLDNRTGIGGGVMHAGNKYFYNGEMDSNVCAVYCDNQTEGFGAVDFTDTIFESNNIVIWLRNTSSNIVPVTFRNCWSEANGTPLGPTTVTIDSWTGSTQSTQTVSTNQPYIINNPTTIFEKCFATGIVLTRDKSQIYLNNCRVETSTGLNGLPISSSYPDSRIYIQNCYSASPVYATPNIIFNGINNYNDYAYDVTSTNWVNARGRYLPLSYNVITGTNKRTGLSLNFTTGQGYSGQFSGTGTVVSDGVKYTSCNQISGTLGSAQYINFTNAANTNAAGYWATTCDIKLVSSDSGSIRVFIWDANLAQLLLINVPADGNWHTIGGVGYYPGSYSSALWLGGSPGAFVVKLSAYQMIPFSTLGDAEEFLASRTYLG